MTTAQTIHYNRRTEICKLLEKAEKLAELEVLFPESRDRKEQSREVRNHIRLAIELLNSKLSNK